MFYEKWWAKTKLFVKSNENVYLKDFVSRYHLNNDENIVELLDILAFGISTLVNPSKLANIFKSIKNASISVNTVSRYIEYLQEAFLISCAKRYDVKEKNINTPFKIYFEDIGLRKLDLILGNLNKHTLWKTLFIMNLDIVDLM